jgi:hypothetical protein
MTQSRRNLLDAVLAQLAVTDDSVADTDPGPAHLAELWEGELQADLAEPVIRQIRFDEFLREVVSMGTDIALRMGSAAAQYSIGGDAEDSPAPGEPDPQSIDEPTPPETEE